MSEQLQSMVLARSDAIAGRLDSIVGKIDTLEEKFDVEMAKIPVDIKRRGEELHKMLVTFKYARVAVGCVPRHMLRPQHDLLCGRCCVFPLAFGVSVCIGRSRGNARCLTPA